MLPDPRQFPKKARAALSDEILQAAMKRLETGFVARRTVAAGRLPEFEALRDAARDIKNHTLAHLDAYLELFEENCLAQGGHVHWARDTAEARDIVLEICRAAGAKTVTKGKSMIGEEMEINHHLEANGIEPIETDLGEYIIQIRKEAPSHIIAPASHVSKEQVSADFRKQHTGLEPNRPLDEPDDLLAEARAMLRQKFLNADVGITGANFLIAETGTSVIVTNEGNGDLTQTLPKVHVVLVSIEKCVPTLNDATTLLRVLARSATGQEMSSYTTFSTGPKRAADADGPEQYHVVIMDNGRSEMLSGPFREMLRCIKCGACMNHCPVYRSIGGHAYGSVYPGPMGSVLTPGITDLPSSVHLPQASSFCGKCEEVCPVRIPLPKLLRFWRNEAYEQGLITGVARWGLSLWAFAAKRPGLYRFFADLQMRLLSTLAGRRGRFSSLPFGGGWTRHRDFPAPQGKTFVSQWRAQKKDHEKRRGA